MWRRATTIAFLVGAVIAGTIVLTGSGLSSDERRDVAAAEASIATTGQDRRADQARTAVNRLIEIFRAKPDAEYDGRSMHEVARRCVHRPPAILAALGGSAPAGNEPTPVGA